MDQQGFDITNFPPGWPVSALLSTDWVEITSGELIDLAQFDLSICFQCGLATIGSEGDLLPASCEVEVQVQRNGGDWVPAFRKEWTLSSLESHEYKITVPSDGGVRVRARKSELSSKEVRGDVDFKVVRQAGG